MNTNEPAQPKTEGDWEPITELDLWDLIVKAEPRMNCEQRRLWSVIKIDPQKWELTPFGDLDSGFWAVGLLGESVVWYNDIEDGFNISTYRSFGRIGEYWCNQDDLEHTVQHLLDLIQGDFPVPKCGAPVAGPFTGK